LLHYHSYTVAEVFQYGWYLRTLTGMHPHATSKNSRLDGEVIDDDNADDNDDDDANDEDEDEDDDDDDDEADGNGGDDVFLHSHPNIWAPPIRLSDLFDQPKDLQRNLLASHPPQEVPVIGPQWAQFV